MKKCLEFKTSITEQSNKFNFKVTLSYFVTLANKQLFNDVKINLK